MGGERAHSTSVHLREKLRLWDGGKGWMWGYVQTHCVLAKVYNVEERGTTRREAGEAGKKQTKHISCREMRFSLYSCRVRDIKGILRKPNNELGQKVSSVNEFERFLLHKSRRSSGQNRLNSDGWQPA